LVGDAAGLVDPITGEGLYYALRSAELLAAAVASDEPRAEAAYNAALREQLTPELQAAGEIANRFYHGHFLRAPVLERMTQFGQRCPQFRSLLCDLFSGAQGYGDLRPRLYRQLVPSLWRLALPHGARA
jgi:flavin-dependent dehydrogenase